jgi:hypothetical protein
MWCRNNATRVHRDAGRLAICYRQCMSTIVVLVVALLGVAIAVALAFGSLHVVLRFIASQVITPVREFIARQRERRNAARPDHVDRRVTPAAVPPIND